MLELRGDSHWRDDFVLVSDLRELGASSRHYRDVKAGLMLPVAPGVYLRRSQDEPSAAARYLSSIRATHLALTRPPVFSRYSAALVWNLPIFEHWPPDVHVQHDSRAGYHSRSGLVRHGDSDLGEIWARDGLLITSLARTVADVASMSSLRTAVVIVDAALAGLRDARGNWVRAPLEVEALVEEMGRRGAARGIRQLRWAVRFGDGRNGSPGESVSRLSMHQIGCPPPDLQKVFYDRDGLIGIVDFWWPDYDRIGEFDGRGKYLREKFTQGKEPGQIVVEEKIREDRLRAGGPGVTRWEWEHAISLPRLRAKLSAAGLPCRN